MALFYLLAAAGVILLWVFWASRPLPPVPDEFAIEMNEVSTPMPQFFGFPFTPPAP